MYKLNLDTSIFCRSSLKYLLAKNAVTYFLYFVFFQRVEENIHVFEQSFLTRAHVNFRNPTDTRRDELFLLNFHTLPVVRII